MMKTLEQNFWSLRLILSKLKSESAKGTLKKETGNIKWTRRDIARIITIINERKSCKKVN